MIKKYTNLISAIVATSIFTGCVVSTQNTKIVTSNIDAFKQDYGSDTKKVKKLPKTVAIIPFQADNVKTSQVVTRYFYNNFSALNYKDIELSTINRIIKDTNIDINNLSKDDIKMLGKAFDVDGIIIGRVTDFDKLFAVIYSSVTVGAKIDFYDVNSGEKIWKFKEKAKKREGGFSIDPIGIAMQLALAAYNLRDVQMYRAAEDLFRDVFKTIPNPKFSGIEQAPIIKFSINNIKSKEAFKLGDELLFSIDSEPNLDTYAILPGIKDAIKFQETTKGHYEVKYIIDQNIDSNNYVKYNLVRKNGIEATYSDIYGKLTIDNTPPSTPKISYNIDGTKVNLTLQNIKGDIVTQYVIDGLKNGEYKQLNSSTKSSTLSFNLDKGKELFIKGYFVDIAGNKSVDIMPVKITNYLDNRISMAKKLPKSINKTTINDIYLIDSDTQIGSTLEIAKNGILFIKDGVTITFTENGKIINNGELKLLGTNNSKISIESNSNNNILELNNGTTTISYTKINTIKAIVAKNSSKIKLDNSSIVSQYNALHLKDSSYANVIDCSFEASKDMSNIIIENASDANLDNITFSNKPMFDISVNSTKKSIIKNSKKPRVLGVIDVQK